MDTLLTIASKRELREYAERPIDSEIVRLILEAGRIAGSAANRLAIRPGRRGPFPRGASRDDIEAAFPGWEVVNEEAADTTGAPRWIRREEPRFYRLRRE